MGSDDDIDEHIKNHKGGRIKSAKLPEFERGGNVKKNKFKMDENELAHKLTNVKKARNSNNRKNKQSMLDENELAHKLSDVRHKRLSDSFRNNKKNKIFFQIV